jgi:hypothetical protein
MLDFDALTPAQQKAAGLVAINRDLDANPRVLARLAELGAVKCYEENQGGHPPLIVKRYLMPLPVHIAWCEWCSRQHESED